MKTERSFIKELESKAMQQQGLVHTQMVPDWARGLASWLAVNPWRVLIPISVVMYALWRMAHGPAGREFILGLFGGF